MTIILDGTTGITTPAINSSGDLELPGGTANGVLYLNGSKIATSGSALVFDGTNLGVGTSSPNGKIESVNTNSGADTLLLQVRNNATAASTSSSIRFVNSTSSTSTAGGAEVSAVRNANDGGALTFKTAADSTATLTERLRIDSAGNVGIGTSSPNSKFQVSLTDNQGVHFGSQLSDTDEISLGLGYTEGATYNKIKIIANRAYGNGGGDLFFALNSTAGNSNATTSDSRLTIKGDTGNVGIGTSSPSTKLHVKGPGNYDGNIFADNSSTTGGGLFSIGVNGTRVGFLSTSGSAAGDTSQDLVLYNETNNGIRFYTNETERARITSGGDLLVGTTNASATTGAGFKLLSGTNPRLSIVTGSSTSDTSISLYSTGAGAYRFFVDPSGTIYATVTTISSISDQRYKENIRDLDVGLDAVMALKPRKFDWKEGKGADKKDARGFIAQEFEQVFPDLVDEWRDPAPEGEEPYKSVRQDLIPVLVKAIQEQQAMIEELKAEIDQLKGN